MSDSRNDRPTDAELRRLIEASVPDHAPDFWNKLHHRLSNQEAPSTGRQQVVVSLALPPVHPGDERPDSASHRRRGWIPLAIAASIVGVALSATAVVQFSPKSETPAAPTPSPSVSTAPSTPDPSAEPSNEVSRTEQASPTSNAPQVSTLNRVTPDQALAAVAPGFDVPGEALPTAYTWTDATGEHALVLSVAQEPHQGTVFYEDSQGTTQQRTETLDAPTLHAAMLRKTDDGYDVDRTLTEPGENPCGFDLTNEFLPASVTLSDTDGDGRGEVAVGWAYGCMSDVSQYTIKLALLEGDVKYILRGEGYTDEGLARDLARNDEKFGTDYTPLPSFTPDPPSGGWPEGAFEHAQDVWDTIAF